MAKKVRFKFKPSDYVEGIRFKNDDVKNKMIGEVSDFVLTKVLEDVGNSRSPVTGRKFRGLSAGYGKQKQKEVGHKRPNLELDGDMLDALQVVRMKSGALSLEVGTGLQNAKADGHNNHSGQSSLPRRPFIPKAEEDFRPEIREGIARIVKRFKAEDDGEA